MQKPWILPIPATTKLHRLDKNIEAVSVELTPNDLRDIDDAASKITVQGARYPEKLEQMTGRYSKAETADKRTIRLSAV